MGEKLIIKPRPGVWGQCACMDSLKAVLLSTANCTFEYFSGRFINPINVIYSPDTPRVYYKRTDNGEYTVQLTAQNYSWCQYAYQFSHEFCHILSNYSYSEERQKNAWFEECICEMASLYTLKKMAQQWNINPPYQNWKSYSNTLNSYAENMIQESNQKFKDITFLAWFNTNYEHMCKDPYLREKNRVIAIRLLQMFEQSPENWGSLSYLNLGDLDENSNFFRYLKNWYWYVPSSQKDFIEKIASLFDIDL